MSDKESKDNKNIILQGSGSNSKSLIDDSLANLSDEQISKLREKAGEEALRLEAKSRDINLDYVTGKKVAEDHVDAFDMLNKQGKLTRHSIKSEIKTGAGEMKLESKSGATCFVATATFENANHKDVIYLRYYRDTYLAKTKNGKKFIGWYYRSGPKLANIVQKNKGLKVISKAFIKIFIFFLKSYSNFKH